MIDVVLRGTPYLLEGERAAGVAARISEFDERVNLLRSQGTLDVATLARLRDEWKVEQVYETVGIEGNQLDLNETRLVLARGITITGKPTSDSTDAQNMKDALDLLEELAHSDRPFASKDLREIHHLVLGANGGAGQFRKNEVSISGSTHIPPLGIDVPARVEQALTWLGTTEAPPILVATIIHAWLVHIHPFSDGNGRTARAVMNLILIRAGYPIVLVRRKDRALYYDALAASDDGDIAPLLEIVLKRSEDSLRQIARIRTAETGVTEAVMRARLRAEKEYEAWRYAMLLLLSEIDHEAERARQSSGGTIDIRVREYDQVTPEDFLALLERDPSGNGWFAVLKGTGPLKATSALLLRVGFRSPELARMSHVHARGASLFVSEPDPSHMHPFRTVMPDSPMPVSEIAFDGDRYLVREQAESDQSVARYGAAPLAARIISSFIDGYLSDPPAAQRDG